MDRREFIRTLATGGYAIGVAQFLGVDDFLSAGDGEVPVVTALVREDPDDPWSLTERTRYVPAEWYAAVKKAFELNELLARVAFTGYLGSAVVPGSYENGTAAVSVGISRDWVSLREFIERLIAGFPVDIETIFEGDDFDDEGIDDLDDLEGGADSFEPRLVEQAHSGYAPSGVACETATSLATLGPALYHPETEQSLFVTANHAFKSASEDETHLTLPVEGGDPVAIGTLSATHPVLDLATVEPTSELEPTSLIDSPSPLRVRGQYTRFGLADLMARGERLEKVGAMTGHTTGAIQGIDAVTCFTEAFCRRGQIRWGGEMDLTDGDSGSVSFHEDPDGEDGDVLIAGFNNARTWWPGQSYVWGVSAYKMTERHGYHF
ncbi:hypothetical protein [Natrialba asiatica]|uniref:Uncharacterized protein n=1 Tax=Natrialba asiatica (strain ATCC 700177 / DSM 12278 / JCM 9576 / FERM P-10747 / NBRC 102637 / 172P1) TaxID=29540 RepID=M0ANE5_NATA1|nr:hypothetical protein [Natrialba asiatica]ELZ00020.1 hypothetical protein C481_13529 [Natrialba asiatica DSM 12278]